MTQPFVPLRGSLAIVTIIYFVLSAGHGPEMYRRIL